MVTYKKLRINLSDIYENNNVKCDSPKIAWITQEGLIYPCIGEDYIEIEIPVGTDPKVAFVLQCMDCDVCPPIPIERDICTTSADCSDCEICTGGLCVPLCPDSLCINDTCVECTDNEDCTDNKICSGGKCICPPDKPFVNSKGECVACLSDANCVNCTYCMGGECEPIDCGDGVCDPRTGDCVECNNNGDCGENECCTNGKCNCCAGFHWDSTLLTCVADPECYTNSDCSACKGCVGGNCVEIPIREGYVAVEENGECVILKTCECGINTCPDGYTCVTYQDGICVCTKCEGTCQDNGDCDEGCMCGSNSTCIPSPCYGTCENAGDCGEGCGCLNGECTPCASIDCSINPSACADIIGCECQGNLCKKISDGCETTCTYAGDCGEGCGCLDGECVPCGYFDCEGDCDAIPGCMCNQNGACVDNPSEKECDSDLTLTKQDLGCDITATLTGSTKCTCTPISLGVKLSSSTSNQTDTTSIFILQLRKGNSNNYVFETLPLLSDTSSPIIADNEEPTSGVVSICYTVYYTDMLNQQSHVSPEVCVNQLNLAGIASGSLTITTPTIGSTPLPEKSHYKVTKIAFKYKYTSINLPNGCEYPLGQIDGIYYDISHLPTYYTPSNSLVATPLTSLSERNPLFIWSKSATGVFGSTSIFRKHYPSLTDGYYADSLYGLGQIPESGVLVPSLGELWGNRDYQIAVDCGCAEPASLSDLSFCSPEDIDVTWGEDSCNKEVTLSNFEPCDVNKNITAYEEVGYDIPEDVQAKYYVYMNGAQVATLLWNDTYNRMQIVGGSILPHTFSSKDPITSMSIKLGYTEAEDQCVWEFTPPTLTAPTISTTSFDCSDGSYILRLGKVFDGGLTISNLILPNGVTIVGETSTYYNLNIPINTTITLGIKYSTGCIFYYDIPANTCITNYDVDLTFNAAANCGEDLVLTATVTGGVAPFSYQFRYPNGNGGTTTVDTTSNTITVPADAFSSGSATVSVRDTVSQTVFDSCVLNPVSYTFSATPLVNTCTSTSYSIVITGTPYAEVTTNIPSYTTVTIPAGGTITITKTASGTAGTTVYSYSSMTVDPGGSNECVMALTDTTSVVVGDMPTATVTPTAPAVCSSDATVIAITGTPYAIVNITIYNTTLSTTVGTYNVTLTSGGLGSLTLPTSQAQYRVTKNSVTLGGCTNTATSLFNVYVSTAPVVTILSDTYACNSTLTLYEVQFTSTFSPWGVSVGYLETLGTNLYRVYGVPTETACTITVKNGSCTTTATTQPWECDCSSLTVTPPVGAPDSYEMCENDLTAPTLTVTCTNDVNWWSALTGGTKLQDKDDVVNSLLFVPDLEDVGYGGNWFYAEAEDVNGCTSVRTPIYLAKNPNPGVEIIPPANYCSEENVTFTSNVWNNVETYLWSATGGKIVGSTTGSSCVVLMPADGVAFTVTLDVGNAYGCTNTDTVSDTAATCCEGTPCLEQTVVIDADTHNGKRVIELNSVDQICSEAVAQAIVKTTSVFHDALWDKLCGNDEDYNVGNPGILQVLQHCPDLSHCDTSAITVSWALTPATELHTITVSNCPVTLSTMILSDLTELTFDDSGCSEI